MKATEYVEVDGRRLALTNLEKILYPADSFTKAHVIDYYIRVARWLLPHYARRPITLQRFPDGVRGKSFYEKDAPKHTPEWINTTLVPRSAGGEPIRYICVDDLPTLAWCANVASLELHTFLHRADHVHSPDSIVFDLDPGDGTDLVHCAEVAVLLRARLENDGLSSLAKVSGSKGLQLYVPLNTATTYDDTRSFAEKTARTLEREHPTLIISEMAKAARRGKVFIDWSQNSDFKTTIGVYSLRAKSDSPYVSAPVTWRELETLERSGVDKLRFTPNGLLQRVAKLGDLFAPLLTLQQELSGDRRKPTPAAQTKVASPALTPTRASKTVLSASIAGRAAIKFIEPMQLLTTSRLPDGSEWHYELKLDGYRALAQKQNGQVLLRSRNDNDFTTRFALISRGLQKMPDDTIIDGEVVALDEQGKPSFNLLQNHGSSTSSLVFYAFDLLILRGRDVMREPLSKRRELLLNEALLDLGEPIRFSPTLDASLADLVRSVKAQGLEGSLPKSARASTSRASVRALGRRCESTKAKSLSLAATRRVPEGLRLS